MSQLSSLGIAALALLVERSMHPYEMYQLLITRSEDRLVKVRPGSLYHTVERLTRQGYVTAVGTDREGNRPERTTYRITEAGQLALTERVSEILGTPINEYPEFPVAIAEAHNLPRGVVTELLTRRRWRLVSELESLRVGSTELTQKSLPRKYWIDITYLQAMINAEVAWLDELLADLRSGELDWSREPQQKESAHDNHHNID